MIEMHRIVTVTNPNGETLLIDETYYLALA
jgi:hypothetical protein